MKTATIDKTIKTATNYKLTKATDEVLAKIFAEKMGVSNYKKFLDWRGKILKYVRHKIPELLRDYNWPLLNQMTVWEGHNIVPLILRSEFASLISWTTVTPTFKANYIALWTGSTTPANSDTQLVAETLRATFENRFSVDNVAYLDKFFTSAEVWWTTVSELGIFVDWSGSANTGYLLSRILANEVMAVTETLTINATITIA